MTTKHGRNVVCIQADGGLFYIRHMLNQINIDAVTKDRRMSLSLDYNEAKEFANALLTAIDD